MPKMIAKRTASGKVAKETPSARGAAPATPNKSDKTVGSPKGVMNKQFGRRNLRGNF